MAKRTLCHRPPLIATRCRTCTCCCGSPSSKALAAPNCWSTPACGACWSSVNDYRECTAKIGMARSPQAQWRSPGTRGSATLPDRPPSHEFKSGTDPVRNSNDKAKLTRYLPVPLRFAHQESGGSRSMDRRDDAGPILFRNASRRDTDPRPIRVVFSLMGRSGRGSRPQQDTSEKLPVTRLVPLVHLTSRCNRIGSDLVLWDFPTHRRRRLCGELVGRIGQKSGRGVS